MNVVSVCLSPLCMDLLLIDVKKTLEMENDSWECRDLSSYPNNIFAVVLDSDRRHNLQQRPTLTYVAPCLRISERWCVNVLVSPALIRSFRDSKRWFRPFPSRNIEISVWTDAHPPDVFDTQNIESQRDLR